MIRVGTRASALALTQARSVADAVAAVVADETELVTISTHGDRGEALADKSRWTSALERALLSGEIDVAVHSAKDVPGELAAGTEIVAVPRRADPRDALCGAGSLASLPAGARVGTSSVRRAAQLRAARDDLQVVELRGNVDTRLRKLADGEVDALVLALAGLERLGLEGEVGCVLDALVPAPGQGALIVQARVGDERARAINDPESELCVKIERALASGLQAGCATPLGAHAVPAPAGQVTLSAWVGLPDGTHWIADRCDGQAQRVAANVSARMVAAGARELLGQAQRMAAA